MLILVSFRSQLVLFSPPTMINTFARQKADTMFFNHQPEIYEQGRVTEANSYVSAGDRWTLKLQLAGPTMFYTDGINNHKDERMIKAGFWMECERTW